MWTGCPAHGVGAEIIFWRWHSFPTPWPVEKLRIQKWKWKVTFVKTDDLAVSWFLNVSVPQTNVFVRHGKGRSARLVFSRTGILVGKVDDVPVLCAAIHCCSFARKQSTTRERTKLLCAKSTSTAEICGPLCSSSRSVFFPTEGTTTLSIPLCRRLVEASSPVEFTWRFVPPAFTARTLSFVRFQSGVVFSCLPVVKQGSNTRPPLVAMWVSKRLCAVEKSSYFSIGLRNSLFLICSDSISAGLTLLEAVAEFLGPHVRSMEKVQTSFVLGTQTHVLLPCPAKIVYERAPKSPTGAILLSEQSKICWIVRLPWSSCTVWITHRNRV